MLPDVCGEGTFCVCANHIMYVYVMLSVQLITCTVLGLFTMGTAHEACLVW